jgi:hypothetical protein
VVRDGAVVEQEAWLGDSDRRIRLEGEKDGGGQADEDQDEALDECTSSARGGRDAHSTGRTE